MQIDRMKYKLISLWRSPLVGRLVGACVWRVTNTDTSLLRVASVRACEHAYRCIYQTTIAVTRCKLYRWRIIASRVAVAAGGGAR